MLLRTCPWTLFNTLIWEDNYTFDVAFDPKRDSLGLASSFSTDDVARRVFSLRCWRLQPTGPGVLCDGDLESHGDLGVKPPKSQEANISKHAVQIHQTPTITKATRCNGVTQRKLPKVVAKVDPWCSLMRLNKTRSKMCIQIPTVPHIKTFFLRKSIRNKQTVLHRELEQSNIYKQWHHSLFHPLCLFFFLAVGCWGFANYPGFGQLGTSWWSFGCQSSGGRVPAGSCRCWTFFVRVSWSVVSVGVCFVQCFSGWTGHDWAIVSQVAWLGPIKGLSMFWVLFASSFWDCGWLWRF